MNLWQLWLDAMNDPVAKWVVIIFLLVSLILSAIYFAKWFRDLAVGGQDFASSISNNLSEFEKLYAEGKISTEEYQRLKKVVPRQLVAEMGIDVKKQQPVQHVPRENLEGLNHQNAFNQNAFNQNALSDDCREGLGTEKPDLKSRE